MNATATVRVAKRAVRCTAEQAIAIALRALLRGAVVVIREDSGKLAKLCPVCEGLDPHECDDVCNGTGIVDLGSTDCPACGEDDDGDCACCAEEE